MFEGTLCDVQGLLVGHAQDDMAGTGVTAVLCPEGATGGVDVRGAAPGTRETDLLRCGATVRGPHAVLLSGGSAFGLAAADGAMRWLAEHGYGIEVGTARVPIVVQAIVFDLLYKENKAPDGDMGYAACAAASRTMAQGSVGGGTGATVGKLVPGAMPGKGGLGSASIRLANGATVAALAVVNASGDIYHPHTGALIASATLDGKPVSAESALLSGVRHKAFFGGNTTIGIVATDASLTKEQTNRLATVGHDGLARAIRPAHTDMDGDTIFALSTAACGSMIEETVSLYAAGAEVFARAVANAVEAAR